MKVLVTGAAGFVGSRLSLALLMRGDTVVGVDNLNEYYALSHKERHLADLLPHPQFSFVRADLSNPELLRYLLEHHRPDAIAHLGAMAAVRYSVQHPLKYTEVNVTGTVNLLDAARHIGNPRVVISSTGSVYGRDTPVPFKETACATQPLAPYPASKRAMELFAHYLRLSVALADNGCALLQRLRTAWPPRHDAVAVDAKNLERRDADAF
jgi:UDP-glucuronate 4-epimerase